MSRFDWEYSEEQFANAGDLWWQAVENALSGSRGQTALRDLHTALLELPEKRLISGRVATTEGDVCAVGALALKRRVDAGEEREAVLLDLARLYPASCSICWHAEHEHESDGCAQCAAARQRNIEYRFDPKHAFVKAEDYEESDGGDATASEGVRVGVAYALAWRLAVLNDDDCADCLPEVRYGLVLAWVERALGLESVAA